MVDLLKECSADEILDRVRSEYTVMPRFGFHQPLDYMDVTLPPQFDEVIVAQSLSDLPIPGANDRFGYSPDDNADYINWGKYDHDQMMSVVDTYMGQLHDAAILDFGCSSGRVLRHFDVERIEKSWSLYGCDIQARAIEWMRVNFPLHFNVITSSTLPHLPYQDQTFDLIYGFSVFTHIKYQWDTWLMELRRVLKPGGVLVQSIHTETAWNFYYERRFESWVRENHTPRMYEVDEMDVDYLYYGDVSVSQVFWKKNTAKDLFGRYFEVLELRDPPERSFQDWMICRREEV